MEKYDWRVFYGDIVKGELLSAVKYLEGFPSKRNLVKKYKKRFEGDYIIRSKSAVINAIDAIFQEYYRDIFWRTENRETAFVKLYTNFCKHYSLPLQDNCTFENAHELFDTEIEPRIQAAVEGEGYSYLGGDTQGYMGPYIWKKTKEYKFNVELPSGKTRFTVKMMSGFVSRSWMSFISFDKIGTGGWAIEDGMSCVKKSYARKMLSSRFLVDFLKHEAQHVVDRKNTPDMPGVHLEYRAKLVQLIYAEDIKAFTGFLAEADSSDPQNSHSYASYLIIRDLSQKLFGADYENSMSVWKKNKKAMKKAAGELLSEYPQHMA